MGAEEHMCLSKAGRGLRVLFLDIRIDSYVKIFRHQGTCSTYMCVPVQIISCDSTFFELMYTFAGAFFLLCFGERWN